MAGLLQKVKKEAKKSLKIKKKYFFFMRNFFKRELEKNIVYNRLYAKSL
jgi:hypothetical protein